MDAASNVLYKTHMANLPHHFQSFSHTPRPGWTDAAYSVLRAGHVMAAPDSALSRERHIGQDILFCVSGKGFVRSAGREVAVGKHQLAWLANEAPHGHRSDAEDPWELMWLRLDGPAAPMMRGSIFGENDLFMTPAAPDRIGIWFQRLFAILEHRDPTLDFELNHMIGGLVAMLAETGQGLDHRRPLPEPVTRALAVMRGNITHNWSAATLKGCCGVSATHLRRLFVAHLGMPPHKWLMHERLLNAQNLLTDTNLNVSQIGARCGFADVFHFSREFKRQLGASPAHWRKSEKVF